MPDQKPHALEVIGQAEPVMVEASRAAGEVLGALARIEIDLDELRDMEMAPRRDRRISAIQRRLAELRDIIRPIAHIDVVARDRAQAEEREAMEQLAGAKRVPRDPPRWKRPAGCVCDGHVHAGGVAGCYVGGTLTAACPCKWVD
jgi:hypothetical protein